MGEFWREFSASAETGGLWDRLDKDMSRRSAAPQAGLGIWGQMIASKPGGVWGEAERETILLRRPVRAHTLNLWQEVGDETLILPRRARINVWRALGDKTALLRREDVESALERAANETLVLSRPAQSVFTTDLNMQDLAHYRPRQRPGFALKKMTDAHGEVYYVLKNLREGNYLRLSEEQLFLWQQMDGKSTVRDLAVAYLVKYHSLAIEGLLALIEQLDAGGFLLDPLTDVYAAADASMEARRAQVWWRRLVGAFLEKQFALKGLDSFVAFVYRWGGRVLFWWPVRFLMAGLSALGALAFAYHALR